MGINKTKMNGRIPSRNGRSSSQASSKGEDGSVGNQNGKVLQNGLGRFSTAKKMADEHRRKARDNREKQFEEEKLASQEKRNEELRVHLRTMLDGLLEDMKKDVLANVEKRFSEEKSALKESILLDLDRGDSSFAEEIEKKAGNGENFTDRLAKVKREFQESYKEIVKTEYGHIQADVFETLDHKLEEEKQKWEKTFKNESQRKLRAAEDAVKSDFRVGLEDSQKQCAEILSSVQQRTSSLEQKLTDRIGVMDAETIANVQESERQSTQMILDKLDQRDKFLKEFFVDESDKLRKDVNKVRKDVSNLKSRVCLII